MKLWFLFISFLALFFCLMNCADCAVDTGDSDIDTDTVSNDIDFDIVSNDIVIPATNIGSLSIEELEYYKLSFTLDLVFEEIPHDFTIDDLQVDNASNVQLSDPVSQEISNEVTTEVTTNFTYTVTMDRKSRDTVILTIPLGSYSYSNDIELFNGEIKKSIFYKGIRFDDFSQQVSNNIQTFEVVFAGISSQFIDYYGNGMEDIVFFGTTRRPKAEDSRATVVIMSNTGANYVLFRDSYHGHNRFDNEQFDIYHYKGQLIDVNGDGLHDRISTWSVTDDTNPFIYLRTNTGNGSYPEASAMYNFNNTVTVASQDNLTFIDLYENGLNDLVIGTATDGLRVYSNDGTSASWRYTQLSTADNALVGLGSEYKRIVAEFVDLYDNGKLDLVLGTRNNAVVAYSNTGTTYVKITGEHSPVRDVVGYTSGHSAVRPSFGDLNGDGKLDMLVCYPDYSIKIHLNISTNDTAHYVYFPYP